MANYITLVGNKSRTINKKQGRIIRENKSDAKKIESKYKSDLPNKKE